MPHLLKRLELNGFKSFANKTVLEFPAGITAIVGPNGSGKSNVIDAIRWLLGERDAKNLRGGKGEDLIFAGTPKRPRTGLAQASLHFENPPIDTAQGKQQFFPVEFEEVSVMRQISRDGANEYFLNKSEVRLRDVVDFFAAARLGSRGITVVSQGNSDMVLRASPEERREMIEEVLGLKEYQLKKHEAERRLKSAESNLEKTAALIDEIVPHLRSLKRQTARWEKRDEYVAELEALENRFFGLQLRSLTEKLLASEAELRTHEARHMDLITAKNAAEDRLAHVEANEPKEREELKQLKGVIREIEERRNVLHRELSKLEAQIETLNRRADAPQGISGEKLLSLVHEAKHALQAALHDPSKLEGAVREVIGKIDQLFKQAEAPQPEERRLPPELVSELERVNTALSSLESEIGLLQEKERTLEKSQEAFYTTFKVVLEEVQRARNAVDAWSHVEQGKTLEHERLIMRKDELERQVAQIGRRIDDFAHAEASSEESIDFGEAERRMFRLRGELAAIGEIDEGLIKEAEETEARHAFLVRESEDLEKAKADLKQLIRDLSEKIGTQFEAALGKINEEFQKFFELMFGGGTAKLVLEKREARSGKREVGDEDIPATNVEDSPEDSEDKEEKEPGIEVKVSLPRKRLGSLDALSGGERSLVGIAAVFALISVSPPPFLVLDEIDAPLDERNARRFAEMLKEFSKETQFIIVTHNRATMEAADVLYGVTLGEDGTSRVLSMKFSEEVKAQ